MGDRIVSSRHYDYIFSLHDVADSPGYQSSPILPMSPTPKKAPPRAASFKYQVVAIGTCVDHAPTSLTTPARTMTNIINLPDVLLKHILDFVKTDSYAIIGPVCQQFRGHYKPSEKVTRTSKYTQSSRLFHHLPFKPKSPYLLDDMISRDEVDIIPLVLARGYEWDHFCVDRAAEIGSKTFFQWLRTTELPWLPENAHHSAASAGNLEMMIYLVENNTGFPDSRSLTVAKDLGYSKIVGWLCELQLDPEYVMVQAARFDDVYIFEQAEVVDEKYLYEACVSGSFNVLEYFRMSVGVGPTALDVASAEYFHRFEVVEWCLEFFPDVACARLHQ